MLTSALDEIRKGGTLLEAAAKHRIPRSTLYMRAKALGVTLNPCRNEYTLDDMKQAIEAVLSKYILIYFLYINSKFNLLYKFYSIN